MAPAVTMERSSQAIRTEDLSRVFKTTIGALQQKTKEKENAPGLIPGAFFACVSIKDQFNGTTFAACKPLGPCSTVNSTFWPSIRLR